MKTRSRTAKKRVDLVELTVDDVHPYADKLNASVAFLCRFLCGKES